MTAAPTSTTAPRAASIRRRLVRICPFGRPGVVALVDATGSAPCEVEAEHEDGRRAGGGQKAKGGNDSPLLDDPATVDEGQSHSGEGDGEAYREGGDEGQPQPD